MLDSFYSDNKCNVDKFIFWRKIVVSEKTTSTHTFKVIEKR